MLREGEGSFLKVIKYSYDIFILCAVIQGQFFMLFFRCMGKVFNLVLELHIDIYFRHLLIIKKIHIHMQNVL